MIKRSDWYGLYKGSWKKDVVQEAMSHPAKFSRNLIMHIYNHAREEGWVSPGDVVVDPFGGVGLGALDAMIGGMDWVGVEIEQKFVDIGYQNIEFWRKKYGQMVRGNAVSIKGNSIKLAESLNNHSSSADMSVSSPPFTGVSSDGGWQMLGKYAEEGKLTVDQVGGDPTKSYPSWNKERDTSYGNSDGQMATMKEGDFDMAVSSPPFLQTSGGTNVTATEGVLSDQKLIKRHSAGNAAAKGYGDDPENVGNLPEGDFDMAVSSPPYGGEMFNDRGTKFLIDHNIGLVNGEKFLRSYGDDPYNIGNLPTDDDGFSLAISSPPYGDISQSGGTKGLKEHGTGLTQGEACFSEYGEEEDQMGKMDSTKDSYDLAISSPPYADLPAVDARHLHYDDRRKEESIALSKYNPPVVGYGKTDGQLSAMRDANFSAAITSPPYAEARIGKESGQEQCGHNDSYGEEDDQMGGMRASDFDIAVSSPPFEGVTSDRPSQSIVEGGLKMGASSMGNGYGEEDDQMGNYDRQNFWMASRSVLENLYKLLKPGGHAIFVCKKYVKKGKLVHFDRMWAKLCVAVGFEVVHWHRAWVIDFKGTQTTLDGGTVDIKTERKSFFRRLAERKGSPRVDWETVICVRKPGL